MRIHLPRSFLILVACQFSLSPLSCRDPQTTAPLHIAQRQVVGAPQDPTDFGTLAMAVAMTMQQPEMRQVVVRSMRASPYEHGAMPLQEVLASHPEFAASVSAHLPAGSEGDSVRATIVRPDANYVLVIPSDYEYGTWQGTDDVIVVGAPWFLLSNVDSIIGYDIRGESMHVRVRSEMPFPIVLVTDGAADLLLSPLPYKGTGMGPPVRSFVKWSECRNPDPGQDLDSDGIRDRCEYLLARAFRPKMKVNGKLDDLSREEYWEIEEIPVYRCGDWVVKGRRAVEGQGWACLHSLRPASVDTVVTAFYGFAYYRDIGDFLWGMKHPLGRAHPGDSEFIVVWFDHRDDVGSTIWRVDQAFFSAHWREKPGESSRHVRGESLEWDGEAYGGSPPFTTWVAEGKHANYISRQQCGAGGSTADNCDRNSEVRRFNVVDTAKFALRSFMRTYSRLWEPGYEVFWSAGLKFCGWQDISDRKVCSTSYQESLSYFGFRPHIPPRDPPDSVVITSFTGPTRVRPDDANCTWTVMTSGGTPPIWIRWRGILTGSGFSDGDPYEISGNVSGSGWLNVDAGGGHDQDSIEVSVSTKAPKCLLSP